MIEIVCAMFVVAIKDLKVRLNNLNQLIVKSAICFKLLAQKGETGKQMACALYDKN